MSAPITVYHTGRIAHSKPTPHFASGMLWSREMRFFFANIPAGEYTLELQLKETQRMDAGAADTERPALNVSIDNRLVAERVSVQTEHPDDPYAIVTVPVTVRRQGFDVRLYATHGGLCVPCLCGMRLLQGDTEVYAFNVGDTRERAMWAQAEMDPDAGTIRTTKYEAVLGAGVPLGGIGTGRVELLTNGTLGSFSCANNWDVPTFWTEGSFFALWSQAGDERQAIMLHPPRATGGYDLPTAKAVHYTGRFPKAELQYELDNSPLEVRLRAQGTLTPGSDDLSQLPGATFTFTVTNHGQYPAECSLLMSLENLAGQGGYYYVDTSWNPHRERFDSVNGAHQDAWACDGARGIRFACDRHPRDARERNVFTEYLIAVEGEGISQCLGWNVDADQPGFWAQFAMDGTLPMGDADQRGADGAYRPAGAVAQRRTMAPGESVEITFVLAWYHSGHVTFREGHDHGHAYQQAYPSLDAVAGALFTHRKAMAQRVDDWQAIIADSTLPQWLQHKLINNAFPTTTNSVWTADGFFGIHESPTDMAGAVGTLDQRMASHPFTFAFFPDLDRLELEWFRRCQQPSGEITHMTGNVFDKLGDADTFFCVMGWPDLSCSFIFQTYRHYLYTGDHAYLGTNFNTYVKALAWIATKDEAGLGLPAGGCTYDYEAGVWEIGAPWIYNSICYLAALRVAMASAERLGREEHIPTWQAAFDRGYQSLMTHYWNGRYFKKWVHPGLERENPNCFVAQLAGDWFLRVLGLEPLFPDAITDSVLESIVQLHMLPHYPDIAMDATPDGEDPTGNVYSQQNQPFLGMELIYRGQVTRGLEVLRRRHEAAWQVNRNIWAEGLTTHVPAGTEFLLFDYMTAPASWNVLYALGGVTVDAARGMLRFAPQLDGARIMRLPVFLQDLWLVLDIDLDRAEPARLEVAYQGPEAVEYGMVSVTLPLLGELVVTPVEAC